MDSARSTNNGLSRHEPSLNSHRLSDGGQVSPAASHELVDGNIATVTQLAEGSRERAARRLSRKREQVAQSERREPLRRRILAALASAPMTPSVLSKELDVAAESVSRQLTALRSDGLVEAHAVPGDARQRVYRLNAEGEIQLRQHRAFGASETPPDPTPAQTLRFLQSALENAIAIRRKTNKLDDAVDRITVVFEQARRVKQDELAVQAMAELATTLRQARRFPEMKALLGELDRIALGHGRHAKAAIALPAAAHREYVLGRLGPEHGKDLSTRANHLISAATLYGQLADAPRWGSPEAWRGRQAWTIVVLADNLRTRSQFDDALRCAEAALGSFERLEDPYGRSRCLFMLGFCLRLLGHFDRAWGYLADAHQLAKDHAFEPFQADSLMQLGEVRRCQGELDEARAMLDESLDRAERMQLTVTQAFAQSARGAVDYQAHQLPDAAAALARAHELFVRCGHQEGLALNARRRAIVARAASSSSGGNREMIDVLLGEAFRRYSQLRSPAGVAACEIELGRLHLMYGGQVDETVRSLTCRLDDPNQRDLLELDPWVPHVLDGFAQQLGAEHTGFAERTSRLLRAAERRLAERARHGAQRTMEAIDQVRRQFERRHANFTMDEMGGETRLHQASVDVPQPVGL